MTNTNTFKVFWTNMGYYSQEDFSTLADALAYGKSKCFEFAVHHNNDVVAAWTVFGGTRHFQEVAARWYFSAYPEAREQA
jgi:hypothetical protein